MKLIVKDTKLQETSEILLRHFENLPETEIVIYPEYSETPGIQILKYGNNVKICYHEEVQYYRALGIVLGRKGDFSCSQTAYTDRLGVMFDCSRNGVLKMETVKRYIEYLALLGTICCFIQKIPMKFRSIRILGLFEAGIRKKKFMRWNSMRKNLESKWYRVFRRWRIFGRTCGGRSQKR